MWRWKVDTPIKLEYFRQEFANPADVYLRLAGEEDSIMPKDDSMPFPVVAFIECGLRLPLDIIFREVLHYYKLNLTQLVINSYRVINGIIALASRENARVTLADIQYCYTMCGLKSEKGYVYYLKPRSTQYKLIADLLNSNKGIGDDYFIVSGNWEFLPDDDLHLFPLSRTLFREGDGKSQVFTFTCFSSLSYFDIFICSNVCMFYFCSHSLASKGLSQKLLSQQGF